MTAKPTVFVSHITEERDLALLIKEWLERDFLGAIDVFVSSDSDSIKAGSNWLNEVDAALTSAAFMVLLCSDQSLGRPWLNFEAGAGWMKRIHVMPLCHSGLTPGNLPIPLKLLQGGEATDPDGLRRLYAAIAHKVDLNTPTVAFDGLIESIRKLEAEYAKTPRPTNALPDIRVTATFGKVAEIGRDDSAYPALRIRVENHSPSAFFLDTIFVQGDESIRLVPMKDAYGRLLATDRTIEPGNSYEITIEAGTGVCNLPLSEVVAVDKINRRFVAPPDQFRLDLAEWNAWLKQSVTSDWDRFRGYRGSYFMSLPAIPKKYVPGAPASSVPAEPSPAIESADKDLNLSVEAREYLDVITATYVERGFPSYQTWWFAEGKRDAVHNELAAHGLIKMKGARGSPWALTEKGHKIVLARHKPQAGTGSGNPA